MDYDTFVTLNGRIKKCILFLRGFRIELKYSAAFLMRTQLLPLLSFQPALTFLKTQLSFQ
jgi:hypothetical protein